MEQRFNLAFYVFNCGCIVEKDKMLRYRLKSDDRDTTHCRCPDHKKEPVGIVGYLFDCMDCGKRFFSEKRSQRCDKCATARKKIRQGAAVRKYKKTHKGKEAQSKATIKFKAKQVKPKKQNLKDPSRWNCANRSECLNKNKRRVMMRYLPCKNCKDYVLQHGNHDPLEMRAA